MAKQRKQRPTSRSEATPQTKKESPKKEIEGFGRRLGCANSPETQQAAAGTLFKEKSDLLA